MSADLEQIVRGIYDGWGRGDFTAGTDRFREDTELVLNPEFPDAGTYRGPEEIRAYMRHFLAPWQRITISCEEVIAGEGRVAASILQEATSLSGVFTDFRYWQVWTFDGDAVVRMESIRERADALRAAGLG